MRCIICDKSDWENVDEFRYKAHDMSMCKNCGFISYPKAYKKKEDVIEYYRKDYRPAPTVQNLYQGQRKLHYHHAFLWDDVLSKWKEEKKTNPVIFEVGAAYGMVLQWLKGFAEEGNLLFPDADVSGTELTESFKRNAFHEFGIMLHDDFDDSKKYDLIVSYKVAEHMFDVDKELIRYQRALQKGGKLYISVPTWFNRLHNFGGTGFSLEYYYAKEHVNVWSRQHFEALLKKCGFKVVRYNSSYYDDSYLCVVEPNPTKELKLELPSIKQIQQWLANIKEADLRVNKKDFEGAVKYWPNFPMAWRAVYEYNRKAWHKKGVDAIMKELIEPWIKLDPDNIDSHIMGADIFMRYNKPDKALPILEKILELRPKCEPAILGMVNCYRVLAQSEKDEKKKLEYLNSAKSLANFCKNACLSTFAEAQGLVYTINAEIPIPSTYKIFAEVEAPT